MGKLVQRNWVLIITGVLFLLTAVVVIFQVIDKEKDVYCTFSNQTYKVGEVVKKEGNELCECTNNHQIVCKTVESEEEDSAFNTTNLKFSYKYLNSLGEKEPDSKKVNTVDISQYDTQLSIAIEKEVMCSSDFVAPSQVGYYELLENSIILSTMTSTDPAVYNKPCRISDLYEISNLDIDIKDSFEVFYKNDKGELIDLKACSYNGILYGSGDVFKSIKEDKICSCEEKVVSCK